MPIEVTHSACVDSWMARAAKSLPPDLLLELFERALGALWQRSHLALGSVTLTAIVDRVLHNAAEQFPLLSAVQVAATGVRCDELREQISALKDGELTRGTRFVLIEFLTILGNLTSNILTPALHSALSKVELGDSVGPEIIAENQRKDRGGQSAKGATS
jgi:hypothetical protein